MLFLTSALWSFDVLCLSNIEWSAADLNYDWFWHKETGARNLGPLVVARTQGSEESWPLSFMAPQIGDDISVEVVAWRWSMLSWLDTWSVIELCLVILAVG